VTVDIFVITVLQYALRTHIKVLSRLLRLNNVRCIHKYQYLQLASFITRGMCLNSTDPGIGGYFLSHQDYESWQ
jgi:hypothetical protein